MKIIFLCGSLEPGCDGVGDYVRCLASELIKHGHSVAAVALNDKYIKEYQEENQVFKNISLQVLRIPSLKALKFHGIQIKAWIDQFHPEWLSLQFVPFSFHSKGLLFNLSKYLNLIGSGANWHIMFHELWVGMAKESPIKLKLWGSIQRRIVKQMLKEIKPNFIHCNTSLYKEQLRILGYTSEYLPLFSNVPKEIDFKIICNNLKTGNTVYFILFGTIHPNAPVEQFAKEIAIFSKEEDIQIVLRIVGRSGDELKPWEKTWKAEGLEIEFFGEKSSSCISKLLKTSSVGITTNPLSLIEKSGTVAAMLEHGLPVLSVSKIWRPRIKIDKVSIPGVLQYNIGNLKLCIEGKAPSQCNSVSKVSEKFINSLM